MAIPLGFDAKIFYTTAAVTDVPEITDGELTVAEKSTSSPVFAELDVVTDVTLNMSKSETDITNRSTSGFRAMRGTLKEGELSFDMMWETANTAFQAIFDAYYDNTTLVFAVLDGDWVVDSQGLVAEFDILNFEKSEALEDAQKVSVTAKITIGDKIAGATPVNWVTIVT